MLATSVADVVEALRTAPLLDAAQLVEVTDRLQPSFPDGHDLTTELVRRGWLTPFQRDYVLNGRIEDLQVGPYLLLERLGQGGMGEVFKARHLLLNRVVALKVTRKDILADPTYERRLLREIQATAQLSHPNIVTAHDAARVGDTHFFAMEFVEGTDLGKVVRDKGRLAIDRACDYIRQAALGLQHAHERGLVHRDIKPSNLLLTAEGSLIKITDLGVVRMGCAPEETALTSAGAVVGTPDYLAPEQATNARNVDIRADLYSLGCTLYHLLAGQPPFPDGTGLEKLFKHVQEEPTPVQAVRPEVPPALSAVVHKLMLKRPEDRYQTPAEVAAALEPFTRPVSPVAVPVAPTTAKATEPAPKPPRRSLRRVLAVLGMVLALGGVGWAYWHSRGADSSKANKPPVTNSLDMQLAWIPAGEFTMGSPPGEAGGRDDEGPPHPVTLTRPFYLATHETTVANFRAFVQATRYLTKTEEDGKGALRWNADKRAWEPDPKCTWRNPGWRQEDDEPVVCLSRYDALAFCYWLSRKEGKTYRLPTEAEWEYACRAGTTTPFASGPGLSSGQANCAARGSQGQTNRVGSFAANAWGLHDMHGNVWEWCADFYSSTYYRESPSRDPRGPEQGLWGVLRGGSWQSSGPDCRSAARLGVVLDSRRNDLGFRVVLEVGIR
jgi:formylglycine-generating enzyme required for sulfatase activity/tRNA A-37 threonylcarbamoyl transferase component Bud32